MNQRKQESLKRHAEADQLKAKHDVSASGSNELLSGNEQSCFVYAARYAHSRDTGAAMQVVNTILHNWHRFDYRTQQQLKTEADEATYNQEDWQQLIDR